MSFCCATLPNKGIEGSWDKYSANQYNSFCLLHTKNFLCQEFSKGSNKQKERISLLPLWLSGLENSSVETLQTHWVSVALCCDSWSVPVRPATFIHRGVSEVRGQEQEAVFGCRKIKESRKPLNLWCLTPPVVSCPHCGHVISPEQVHLTDWTLWPLRSLKSLPSWLCGKHYRGVFRTSCHKPEGSWAECEEECVWFLTSLCWGNDSKGGGVLTLCWDLTVSFVRRHITATEKENIFGKKVTYLQVNKGQICVSKHVTFTTL